MAEIPDFLRDKGQELSVELAIDALIAAKGNITAAGRMLLCRRTKLKNLIDRTPELMVLLEEIRDETIDNAEWNVFAAVEMGDQNASRFVLQTIGKNRGYSTREEVTGKDGDPLGERPPVIVFMGYPDEENDDSPAEA